jgi:hypothetical protein
MQGIKRISNVQFPMTNKFPIINDQLPKNKIILKSLRSLSHYKILGFWDLALGY